MLLEPKPGTYALILYCSADYGIQIGRLGTMRLEPGYYVYLGSALGPGGLAARIAHHQKRSLRPHWHIDYLRTHTQIHCIWFCQQLALPRQSTRGFPAGLEQPELKRLRYYRRSAR